MVKTAILQMPDTSPARSTAIMLRAAGYDVFLAGMPILDELARMNYGGALTSNEALVQNWGYEKLDLPRAGLDLMDRCDLYCDIKAHRLHDRLVNRWPNLRGKILWTRINGSAPEHVVRNGTDHGDEVNPPCPVLTPNLWYREPEVPCPQCRGRCLIESKDRWMKGEQFPDCLCKGWGRIALTCQQEGRTYACWPPFEDFDAHASVPRAASGFTPPVCLIHNVNGWGYGLLCSLLRERVGLRVWGRGSPDGLIGHRETMGHLSRAVAMVHLKSSDSPGYALLEAAASACPLVVPRRLIWRSRMGDLFEPGVTCLTFDTETHDSLTDETAAECCREVQDRLNLLADPDTNRRFGDAIQHRLQEVMWRGSKAADVESLRNFFARNFK